jgi:hypothetical protein
VTVVQLDDWARAAGGPTAKIAATTKIKLVNLQLITKLLKQKWGRKNITSIALQFIRKLLVEKRRTSNIARFTYSL